MPAAKSVQDLQKITAAEPRNAAAWHQLGNALLDDGKFDRGISAFRRALRIDDSLAEVHNDLGAAYFEKRWYGEAEDYFRKAIAAKPDHGVAYANLGAALRAQGRLSEGRRAFQRALLLRLRAFLPPGMRWRVPSAALPANAPPAASTSPIGQLKALAAALKVGRPQQALAMAQDLHGRFPDDPDVLHLLGVAFEDRREYDTALHNVREAIARKPERTEYYISLARILARAHRLEEAVQAAAHAARLEPGSAQVFATLAGVYSPWRDDLAAEAARQAVKLDPASDIGHGNLASALWSLGQLDEAEIHAREAVRLNPKQLSFRANLALILKDLGRMEEALALYHQLIDEAPDYPKMCLDMGTLALECDGNLDSARTWYRKAQASGDPRPFLSEAIADLMEGKYETGWERYEVRKQTPDQARWDRSFAGFRAWQGETLESGKLLVYSEQGLGDEIMFASMLPDLARRVPQVILLCDHRLGALFKRSFPEFHMVPADTSRVEPDKLGLTEATCAVAAGSLGRYFRRRVEDFPSHRGYLTPDAAKIAAHRARLAGVGAGLKIGLSWIGGVQRTGRSRRSLSLELLRPVLEQPGVQWTSLQHPDASAELAAFRERSGIVIHEFPGVTRDMDELAALVGALDLVLTVCNTTVHVAGAIGKEVLVMAPFVPEWRYGMTGERMIWYPSARVLRQSRYGDWSNVIQGVHSALQARAAA